MAPSNSEEPTVECRLCGVYTPRSSIRKEMADKIKGKYFFVNFLAKKKVQTGLLISLQRELIAMPVFEQMKAVVAKNRGINSVLR
jgi:hypothetical protein